MLPEVRMTRVIDAIGLHRKRKLSCEEAGGLLGISERHFRRLRDAYEAYGAEGIIDRRRGRASGRRAGVDEIEWVLEEFRTREAVLARLHVDEERASDARADDEGAEALGAPQEAGAPAIARDAPVSGRVEACLAAAGA